MSDSNFLEGVYDNFSDDEDFLDGINVKSFKVTFLLYGDITEEYVETQLKPRLQKQVGFVFLPIWTVDDVVKDLGKYQDDYLKLDNEVTKIEVALLHLAMTEPGLILSGPVQNIDIAKFNTYQDFNNSDNTEPVILEQGHGMPFLGLFASYASLPAVENMIKSRLGHEDVVDGGAIVMDVTKSPIFSLN